MRFTLTIEPVSLWLESPRRAFFAYSLSSGRKEPHPEDLRVGDWMRKVFGWVVMSNPKPGR